MPGQGFTVVTGAPRHRAGERWIENWGQWWGKRAGVESCVCFCHHLVLLQFPAFSILSWRDEQAKAKLWQSCTHQHPSQEDATQLSVGTIQERCWSWLRDALTGKLSRGWMTHLVTNDVWYPPAQNALQYQQPWNKHIKRKTRLNISCGYSSCQDCTSRLASKNISVHEVLVLWSHQS